MLLAMTIVAVVEGLFIGLIFYLGTQKPAPEISGKVRDGVMFRFDPNTCTLKMVYDLPHEGMGTLRVFPGSYGPSFKVTGYGKGEEVGYLDLFPHTEGGDAQFVIYNTSDEDNPAFVGLGPIADHKQEK